MSSEQRKLLCYIGAGYRDEDIAHELGYSFSKVRGQVRRLREKLNAADRIDLISIAQDCGCAKPEWKQMGLVGNYEQYD